MALKFEELRVLQAAEVVSDGIWRLVVGWKPFAREVVGGQMARAADSIGANIAEAYGRFHYGEKLQFLYYARGSLFETKYWLNRARERELIPPALAEDYASQLTDLARQLNGFAANVKAQRRGSQKRAETVREDAIEYVTDDSGDVPMPLFTKENLQWLEAVPNTQSPIPNP
jgi:four helix bundle protein